MKTNTLGCLYLIPVTLGEPAVTPQTSKLERQTTPRDVLPEAVLNTLGFIDTYIVEHEKTARRFIKSILPEKSQASLHLSTLNKHTETSAHAHMLQPCLEGIDVGLMSESGCPGIADPGAVIVKLAHEKGIRVIPLVGPSSILLALMASGMNGQRFAFNGYLPIDTSEKKQALKMFEKQSATHHQSQIFIETPYRNMKLFADLLQWLHPMTQLCIACDLTLPTEYIKTYRIADWKKQVVALQNRPCIFILLS